jgi:hypothetical protein
VSRAAGCHRPILKPAWDWLCSCVSRWFSRERRAYSLAIVRRYTDANGSFVGELYLLGTFAGVLSYQMIGYSLDTLPFDTHTPESFDLDTKHDFLAAMPVGCVRVGAQHPRDNDAVRKHIAKLAAKGTLALQVQNRFIEHVLDKKPL